MKTTREGAKKVCKNGLKCGSQEYSCLETLQNAGNTGVSEGFSVGKFRHREQS